MVLAFTLSALRALDDPRAATVEAREWSAVVGVVSDRPESSVRNFTRANRVRRDFFPGGRGVRESLSYVDERFPADRFVLVGTGEDHRAVAEAAGWEYRPVEEAAEKAGWALVERRSESTVGRLRDRLGRLF